MNNGHHGTLYDQGKADRIHQRGSVLATVWGAFSFRCLWCVWGSPPPPPPSVSLYSLFIVVSFLLNGAPRIGTCPINPSFQLLGVVVRTERYGRVRHKAPNVIMTAFPFNTFIVLFCFSTFPAPWDDRECHYWWQLTSSILGYIVPRRTLPATEERFFPWAGPLAQCSHRHGPTGLLPHTIALQNPTVRLLGRRGGFWWYWASISACHVRPSTKGQSLFVCPRHVPGCETFF